MKKNFLALGTCAFAFALGLVACGDDSGSNSGSNGVKGEVIALADGSGEKVCDDKLEGWVAEAVGKDFRRCQNGEWTKITASEASAEDEIIGGVTVLQSSSSIIEESSSSSAKDSGSVEDSSSSNVIASEAKQSSSSVIVSSSSTPTEDPGSSSSVKDLEQVDGSSSSVIASEAKQSSSSVVSSSSVASSSSVESSSSVVSSSSEKSSSSVASSSSVKSSSSVASSSSAKSSSSSVVSSSSSSSNQIKDPSSSSVASSSSMKVAWAYLNPDIDYGEFVDERDGQVYKTVTIGTKTWMAENLNYDPGDVSDMGRYAWSGCYNNKSDFCTKYGRLYTWEVAMDDARCGYGKCNALLKPVTPVRGVCPQGWHLPSHFEFEQLINFIDPTFGYNHTTNASSSTASKYLKSQSGWNSSGNGTDAYGFSALPGGYRDGNGGFYREGYNAYFWSSGEYDSNFVFFLDLFHDYDDAHLYWSYKDLARSVRCLQD